MFTSYESQGLRDLRLWALWTIHPDGSRWQPLVSNFANGASAFHFMTQLSDGHVVVEEYYNLNNLGFGTYYKLAPHAPEGEALLRSRFPQGRPQPAVQRRALQSHSVHAARPGMADALRHRLRRRRRRLSDRNNPTRRAWAK